MTKGLFTLQALTLLITVIWHSDINIQ